MGTHTAGALLLSFSLAAVGAAACGSSADTSGAAGSSAAAQAVPSRSGPADDAGAMADLRASDKWTDPRCGWLQTGAHIVATRDDEALYRATSQMGYIDLIETGQAAQHNRLAPVFNVTLTQRGKDASASCGTPSKPTVFYVPTSRRQFTSGKFLKQEPGGRTVYEVDFTWLPTPIGDQVAHVLKGAMAIKTGPYRAKVYMKKMRAGVHAGANGWTVDAIDDRGAQQIR